MTVMQCRAFFACSMVKFARTLASYIAIFKYTPEMHLSIIYILFIILVRA